MSSHGSHDDAGARPGPHPDAIAQRQASDVTSYLLAGPLTFGLIGWGLDHWWGTAFALPVGLVTGVALALYVVWIRYGRG